ncbi:EndoU domain-containing protein, partial [Chromatiaceae bacterium AAb-1]|nr:EndoU domain-containing protein [Chromatiaceae bacterium AAb-1]
SIGGLTRFTGVQGGSAAGAAWTDLGTGLQNLASYAYNDLPGFASAIAVDPFINAYDRYADIYNNDGLAAMMGTMATDGLVKGILEGPTRGIGIDIPAVTKKGGTGNSSGNTSGSGSSQGSEANSNTTIVDSKATTHILDGDGPKGGGHRYGTGIPGKSEFPQSWSDERIMYVVSDIATDPNISWTPPHPTNGYVTGSKVVEGVDVKVIYDPAKGRVVSAYPTNTPRNPKP